jgi:hypothetical protein
MIAKMEEDQGLWIGQSAFHAPWMFFCQESGRNDDCAILHQQQGKVILLATFHAYSRHCSRTTQAISAIRIIILAMDSRAFPGGPMVAATFH